MNIPKHPISSNSDDYSDIINLPRPISKTRPRMNKKSRAAQFAPYAALVGHRDIISGEEQVAFAKDNINREITTELDLEVLSLTENSEVIDEDNDELDFSQENPLDG